ncbi:MAG: hypothetical protein IPO77_02385 [Acidobacteria bacterium]|nr:hypothetical protein [Acidobacteriota bacterium]
MKRLITAGLIGLLLQNWGCSFLDLSGGCGNEIIKEIIAPDQKYKVIIFQRDCGATTGYSTQISFMPANEKLPNKEGNIFSCDSDHGKAPAGPGGGPPVEVKWKEGNILEIIHDTDARIFFAANERSGVKIEYAKKDF